MTSPLIQAVKHDQVDATRLLLREGARVHTYDRLHNGPLHHAALNGSLPICKLLLDMCDDIDINDPDHLGNTALHYAYACRFTDICEFLLERGADPNMISRTCIFGRSMPPPPELRRIMMNYGADGRVGSAIWYNT